MVPLIIMKIIVKSGLVLLLLQAACSQADTVTNIAAGLYHSLFLKPDGSLWAMGQNDVGQLGDGTQNNTNRPEQIVPSGVIAVAAGGQHSLFLKSDGSLWAMGYDAFGQLGNGTNTSAVNSRPEQIVSGNVTAIAAGSYHSLFLVSGGSLWTMGRDVEGELGDGNFVNGINTPEQIVPSGVTAIAGGESHSLFLKSDGSLWAMGDNTDGQLGDGTLTSTNRPEQIVSNGVIAIAAGFNHSLFLKSDGSLWAMGSDGYGQLGIGKYNSGTNRPVQVVSNGVLAVDAGGNTSLFLESGGSFWSMGQNSYGTNGTLSNSNRPVQIVASGVVALARGHTHGLFAKSDGSIWAMGDDSLGQLGDGFTNSISIPEQIFPSPQPALTSITASGTNFQFQATCPSGGTFYLLAGTNLTEPFSQWTRVWTNSVNARGTNNFSATISTAISSGDGQFYILQSQ
jgi:alpha-tubulin suppressor-like RCC1 family protein